MERSNARCVCRPAGLGSDGRNIVGLSLPRVIGQSHVSLGAPRPNYARRALKPVSGHGSPTNEKALMALLTHAYPSIIDWLIKRSQNVCCTPV